MPLRCMMIKQGQNGAMPDRPSNMLRQLRNERAYGTEDVAWPTQIRQRAARQLSRSLDPARLLASVLDVDAEAQTVIDLREHAVR